MYKVLNKLDMNIDEYLIDNHPKNIKICPFRINTKIEKPSIYGIMEDDNKEIKKPFLEYLLCNKNDELFFF